MLWKKMSVFSFFDALIKIWVQNQIENITSSGYYHCFSIYFRFLDTSDYRKWSKPLPSHNFNLRLCPTKKVWVNIVSEAAVIERPDFTIVKTRHKPSSVRHFNFGGLFLWLINDVKLSAETGKWADAKKRAN